MSDKELKEVKQDDKDEQDSTCSTSTEGNNEAHKELGLVITALQSTVKQNSEKEVKHEYDIDEADELHSDIDSVVTTESATNDTTTVSEDTLSIPKDQKSNTLDEKVQDSLEDITDQISPLEEEKEVHLEDEQPIVDDIVPPTPGIAPKRQTFEINNRNSEDAFDTDSYSENLIALNKINIKDIKENTLSPRQQEKAGK